MRLLHSRLILLVFILLSTRQTQAQSPACSIAASVRCPQGISCADFVVLETDGSLLNEMGEDDFDIEFFVVSPDHQYILLQELDTNSGEPRVKIITLEENAYETINLIPAASFLGWSADSTKVALKDELNNLLIYSLSAESITAQLPEGELSVFEVRWSREGNAIAFIAQQGGISADPSLSLYIWNLEDELIRLTSPEVEVGWYYDQYVWLEEGVLVFSGCAEGNCSLYVSDLRGEVTPILTGDYRIVESFHRVNNLLVIEDTTLLHDLSVNPETGETTLRPLGELEQHDNLFLTSFSLDDRYVSLRSSDDTWLILDTETSSLDSPEVPVLPEDAGDWHPDNHTLLWSNGNELIMYDADIDEVNALPLPDLEGELHSTQWLCPG